MDMAGRRTQSQGCLWLLALWGGLALALGCCGDATFVFVQVDRERALYSKAEVELQELRKGLLRHYVDHGSYPATLSGLSGWPAIPINPFTRRPYKYSANGESFELVFLGADDMPGGVGIDADMILTDQP